MASSIPTTIPRSEWRIRVLLIVISLLVALALAEVATRLIYPISDRRDNLTLDGKPITSFVTPGSVYRQISNEYDAVTTITEQGYRAPAVNGNPDIVFIGDSFTFGYGLNDEQTFPSIYCRQQQRSCANLGLPGSGTLKQVERLEELIERQQWRPREVRLFFFGMSTSFSAGNDFVDNYNRAMAGESTQQVAARREQAKESTGFAERIIGLQAVLLRYSNLLRLVKFYAGPRLKAAVLAEPGPERMQKSLEATRQSLQRLDELSRRIGFEYRVYLFVPVQDILRDSYADTLKTLSAVSPHPVIPTAQIFLDAPTRYYYAFDGHFNPQGSARIAEFLVAEDGKDSGS